MVRTKNSGRAAPSAAAGRGPLRTITQRRTSSTTARASTTRASTTRASTTRASTTRASTSRGGAATRRRTPATTSRANPSLVARVGRAVRIGPVIQFDSSDDSSFTELDESMSSLADRENSPGLDDSFEMDDSRLLEPNHYVHDSFVVADDGSDLSDSDISNDSFDSDSNDDLDLLNDDVASRSTTPAPEEFVDAPSELQESVIRSSEHGHCSICFEDAPYDPVGCLICRQLIGCKKCVTRWFETGKKKQQRQEENAANHFMCPLCRHPWEQQPEVDSIFFLD